MTDTFRGRQSADLSKMIDCECGGTFHASAIMDHLETHQHKRYLQINKDTEHNQLEVKRMMKFVTERV
jgi:hypothetical protein